MSDAGHTHYVGDGCEPDGHREDPLVAGKLNAASRHARLREHLAAGHLEGEDYDTVTELLDAYRANVRGRGQEIVRLTADRDDWRRLANDNLLLIAETANERDAALRAIEAHHTRKTEPRCSPLPGHEGKYGCSDADLRLWALLDQEPSDG